MVGGRGGSVRGAVLGSCCFMYLDLLLVWYSSIVEPLKEDLPSSVPGSILAALEELHFGYNNNYIQVVNQGL